MSTVFEACTSKSLVFAKLISPDGGSFTESLVDERTRFDVWASTLGARLKPNCSMSLDYRLRDAPIYIDMVVSDLGISRQSLESCRCTDAKPWPYYSFIEAEIVRSNAFASSIDRRED